MTTGIRVHLGNLDITHFVKSVEWSGHCEKPNRQLNVSIINTQDGRKQAFKVTEGSQLLFIWNGKPLFTGYVFSFDIDAKGNSSITCYDANIYLLKNKDTRKFVNKKASDIVRQLATDFRIPFGHIEDTGYVIPSLILRDMTLYDMIVTALTLTRKQTGRRYFITNELGKTTLRSVAANPNRFVISAGSNIMSANYSRSIEDTKTRVKVTGGDKKKPTTAIESNGDLQKRFGIMQHVEEMDEKAKPAQVKQRASTLLKELAVINDQASVEALGSPNVFTGVGVYVEEPMTKIIGNYYVSEDTHRFDANRLHTMSLTLSYTLELPKLDYEGPAQETKPKAKRRSKKPTTKVLKKVEVKPK